MRRASLVVAGAAIFLSLTPVPAGAGGGGGGACVEGDYAGAVSGPTAEVEMRFSCFSPTVLHVEPGTEVTFVNRDPYLHNLSGPSGTFLESQGLQDFRKGHEQAYLLESPGVFPFMCYLHPGMAGAIVVGGGLAEGIPGSGPQRRQAIQPVQVTADAESSTASLTVGLGIALVLLLAAIVSLATRRTQSLTGV